MALVDIVSSIFGGGVTGILGAAVSRYADYKTKQLDLDVQRLKFTNEIELKNIDAKIMDLEWQRRDSIAAKELEARIEVADSWAFNKSLTAEPPTYSNPSKLTKAQNAYLAFVDGVRGLIRPVITLYLCAITTAVYMQAGAIIKQQPITIEQSVGIYTQISSTILYLTTTCILWYFGVRTKDQPSKRK